MTSEFLKDISELELLRKTAARKNVQNLLDQNLKIWRTKLNTLKEKELSSNVLVTDSSKNNSDNTVVRSYKKLTTYAFDESDKFVKLYYTISPITSLSNEKITFKFTDNSFDVRCVDVDGIDYEMSAVGLLHDIDNTKSVIKIKSDSLLIMLKKKNEGVIWNSLVKLEKDKKETKLPKFDEGGDPQDSLMKMMKQMYDDGDDEMKRTIRKAWHESQSKKSEVNSNEF